MKKYTTAILALLFSHDILLCMEQNRRLSQEKLREIVIHKMSKNNCSICLENIPLQERIIFDPCNHEVHNECFDQLIRDSKEYLQKCPECKEQFTQPFQLLQDGLRVNTGDAQNVFEAYLHEKPKTRCCSTCTEEEFWTFATIGASMLGLIINLAYCICMIYALIAGSIFGFKMFYWVLSILLSKFYYVPR